MKNIYNKYFILFKIFIILIIFTSITLIYSLKIIESFYNNDDEIITLNNNLGVITCPYKPDYVCDIIRSTVIWEDYMHREFEKYVKPGDIVIDAGAFVGIHTIKLSRLVGDSGMVYAFEAHPITFNILKNNVEMNNLKNVNIYNLGVGDKPGKIEIKKLDPIPNMGGTMWKYSENNNSENTNTTDVVTIDSLNLPKIDFMKADIEGMEDKLFKGMEKTIMKYRPIILFESHPDKQEIDFEVLKKYNYKIENINTESHDWIATPN